MKVLKYTLLELMVAMLIFVIMMGILMSTFSMAADVAANEGNKLSITSDANIFYTYLTRDLSAVLSQPLPAPITISDSSPYIEKKDPDETSAIRTLNDYGLKMSYTVSSTSVKLSFYSDTPEYAALTDDLNDPLSNNVLKVEYEFIKGENKLYRTMYAWDPTASPPTSVDDEKGMILEGVENFGFTIWEDYAGGRSLATITFTTGATSKELDTIPACITFNAELTNPNPDTPQAVKDRYKRTISKTVYLNR